MSLARSGKAKSLHRHTLLAENPPSDLSRKKKTESISVENDWVNEIRKGIQPYVDLELSDIPKSLVNFIKKHL